MDQSSNLVKKVNKLIKYTGLERNFGEITYIERLYEESLYDPYQVNFIKLNR
jgi:hypothetical protein